MKTLKSTTFKYVLSEIPLMQKYFCEKQPDAVISSKVEIKIEKTLEENLKENKTSTETKLEEVAKIAKQILKEDVLEIIKEQNKETKFIAYTNPQSTTGIYNAAEEFYESESTNYYNNLMPEEKTTFADWKPEYHEQKTEQQAEQTQYLARESNEFGVQLTRTGMPTRDEQTAFSANAVNTEAMYMFKLLNPGWWHCLYELKAINPSFN